jgi:hypothetical protein
MGKHKMSLRSNDKEGFVRAFTDEWLDMEKEYQVVLEMTISPSDRKGITRLAVTAYKAGEGHTGLAQGVYSCEFPTAAVESFEACLYRCVIRLERVIRDRRDFPMGKA